MKRTKIICTVGPACADRETLKAMIQAGMNVARLNFSHGTHEDHKKLMDLVKEVRTEMGQPIAIMLDTKGPEYRIKTFAGGKVILEDGQRFALTAEDVQGDQHRVSVSYKNMVKELNVGDAVLINNGLVRLEVEELTDTDAICRVINGGVLSDRKSMSFPNKVMHQAYLSEQDKKDLLFGIENDVDIIACSFVSTERDVLDVRRFLEENGSTDIDLVAKIENRSGVDNIDAIIKESDGIMIARGDMGVEIPFEELPAIQKKLIRTCRLKGKRVITATEMLESMIEKPRPTRAEISDVANAVYDGTSVLMLSGETAAGKYPVEAVQAMARIAEQTEANIDYVKRFHQSSFEIKNDIDALSHAAAALAIDVNAQLIVVCSRTGKTARMVSRFRAPKWILGMTTSEKQWRKLGMSWSVLPVLCSEEFQSTDVLFYHAMTEAKLSGMAKPGDRIVITGGVTNGRSGNTSLIKLETLR
ncbi:MAG: pyruvate kinase [Clostridia bacterium]|nr:pyruvate kinase [Clostridia bacterium]